MNDLKLDEVSHDLVITNSDLSLLNNEAQVSKQTLKINLLTYQGEWFTDTTLGLPYLQEIFKKGTGKKYIDTLYQTTILGSYNIDSIIDFQSTLDFERKYTLSFSAYTTDGEIISFNNLSI